MIWRVECGESGRWKGQCAALLEGDVIFEKEEVDVFMDGTFEMLPVERSGEDIFAYTMGSVVDNKKALVLFNSSDKQQNFSIPGHESWWKLIGRNTVAKAGKRGMALTAYERIIFCNW